MTSHLGVLVLFAGSVAVVFALLLREDTLDQFRLGLRIFAGLLVGALGAGWVMFLLAP